jgi:hypothetical protein
MDPIRNHGLEVVSKSARAARFQHETVKAFLELVGATGLESPHDITPERIHRRVTADRTKTLAEIHHFEADGTLLDQSAAADLQYAYDRARAETFAPASIGNAPTGSAKAPAPVS